MALGEVRCVWAACGERRHHKDRQRHEDDHQKHERRAHGLVDSRQVDEREDCYGGECERPRRRRRDVVSKREGHRRAACELADDECSTREIAPHVAEAPPSVDVRPAGLGVERRESRG